MTENASGFQVGDRVQVCDITSEKILPTCDFYGTVTGFNNDLVIVESRDKQGRVIQEHFPRKFLRVVNDETQTPE